jgi:hypothetical protein
MRRRSLPPPSLAAPYRNSINGAKAKRSWSARADAAQGSEIELRPEREPRCSRTFLTEAPLVQEGEHRRRATTALLDAEDLLEQRYILTAALP